MRMVTTGRTIASELFGDAIDRSGESITHGFSKNASFTGKTGLMVHFGHPLLLPWLTLGPLTLPAVLCRFKSVIRFNS